MSAPVARHLDNALRLAEAGYAVCPAKHHSRGPDFIPGMYEHGFNDATRDAALIRSWWERKPSAGIMINLEKSGLFAIDCDSVEAEAEAVANGLPRTTERHSRHVAYIYRCPEASPPHRAIRVGRNEKLDLLTSGGLVAFNIHPEGHTVFLTAITPVSELPLPPMWAVNMHLLDAERNERPPWDGSEGTDTPDDFAALLSAMECERSGCACHRTAARGEGKTHCPVCTGQNPPMKVDYLHGRILVHCHRGCSQHDVIAALRADSLWRSPQPAVRPSGNGTVSSDDHDGVVVAFRRCTDMGNGQRFLDRFQGKALYCSVWKKWVLWNGRYWQIDETQRAMRWASEIPQRIYAEAAQSSDQKVRDAIAAWAHKTESVAARVALLRDASARLWAEPSFFDADPWLLNVRNGTVDLRSGELRPHSRDDYITKLVDVEYDPDATAPRWLAFLTRVLPDEAVRAFVQRAAGYSATGSARERCLLVMIGSGKNGKGVFIQTLRGILGDYAVRTPSNTFLVTRNDNAIPNDLAALRGARMCFASETNEGRRLDEATIKDMTGGEDISACFKYGEFFNFTPTFTPWLATNHKPVIRGTDEAIWDRMRLIPFGVRIPDDEQDVALSDALKSEYPGILAWIVRGAAEWVKLGLRNPEAVRSETAKYRAEMDTIGRFLEDCCIVEEGEYALSNAIYTEYKNWCEQSGEKPLSGTALGRALGEKGFPSGQLTTGNRARIRSGFRLISSNDVDGRGYWHDEYGTG